MRLVERMPEDEMIATFLRGELDSGRYGEKLRGLLARDGKSAEVLADARERAYRRQLLDEHRAYERREGLFFGFPRDVEWFRAEVSREELLETRFINWDWWFRISGGSRRPRDAARRIRAGKVPGVTPEEHEPYLASDAKLIVATTPVYSPLVLIEGHVRLTAYALFPHAVPEVTEIVLGVSDEMAGWSEF